MRRGGRFLKQIGPNKWQAISQAEARIKVAQCFQYHKRRLAARATGATINEEALSNTSSVEDDAEDFDDAEPGVAVAEEETETNLQPTVHDDMEMMVAEPLPYGALFHVVSPAASKEIHNEQGFSLNSQSAPSLQNLLCLPTLQDGGHGLSSSFAANNNFQTSFMDFDPTEALLSSIDTIDLSWWSES